MFNLFEKIKFFIFSLVILIRRNKMALNDIDTKLSKYLNFNNGFFVELGANDGVRQSNTYYLEKSKNWRGILVEPFDKNYELCKKNRLNSNVSCAACVPFDFQEKKLEMLYADLMSISCKLSRLSISDIQKHVEQGKKFLKKRERVFSFFANAIPLNSILEAQFAPAIIDFLSLDVEGAELDVLNGINFSKFNFKYILIETRNFAELMSFMKKKNYTYVEHLSSHDALFKYNKF